MTGMQASPGSSETNADNMSDSGLSQRVPKCARCRCHGINCELKGHKEKCQFKDCRCRSCLLVVERQKITATRVAHLRHQRKMDKQRSNGFYSNYAPLTDEEEYVLSRYVDRPDEHAKRRMYAYEYEYADGRPYRIPAVRYGGFPDHGPHRQYGGYYHSRAWDVQSRNRLSPCMRECCMPWKDKGYSEELLAKKFYHETHRGRNINDELIKERKIDSHDRSRYYGTDYEEGLIHKGGYEERQVKQMEIAERIQREQPTQGLKHLEKIENESAKETEIEVDVEGDHPDLIGNKDMIHNKNAAAIEGKQVVDGKDRSEVSKQNDTIERNGHEDRHRSSNSALNGHQFQGEEYQAKKAKVDDREKEIEEQKRRRDEFIRSKCGEVLSVMFPDFDGRLIKNVAAKSGYDIQAAVEYLLDMKKRLREDETTSAFSAYKIKEPRHENEKEACKCCTGRPPLVPYYATSPVHDETKVDDAQEWRNRRPLLIKEEAIE